ncbi:hypothetical protein [Paenibacillus sp. Leaf72]|uniref:hypothetical protein n=1 Tax=Paenibacillus sp. Leaf72 TaxID=1736234 RepID=UPI0006F827B7|nr:hypothetical protein [Paenibacillus sp. Leaf72]KQN97764.1 hypothetical protein ASF12_21470 [Paenibacillus sp. Leaf72]
MAVFIIGCEMAFWVFVLAGLISRYMLRAPKLGAFLLYCTPVIDLVLLAATVIHLRGGAEASFVHGLAAIYIGCSIAYGHSMIRWADVQFAHRFAGGLAPQKKAKTGEEHARNERLGWLRHLAAWAIGCAVLYGMIIMVNEPPQTVALRQVMEWWTWVLGIDFMISFSYTIWPRKAKAANEKAS